jgi:hypothetical protein
LGVAKVNFATALKQACLAATREKLVNYREPRNPHPSLGMGGRDGAPVAGREAAKLKVKELLEAFGFAWKTGQVFERQRQAARSCARLPSESTPLTSREVVTLLTLASWWGMLEGWPLEDSLRFASAVGDSCTRALGCHDGIFEFEKALAFVAQNHLEIVRMT